MGFYSDPAKGWIEGVAILCAVLVVAVVTATNDYSKDEQFRALNAVKDDVTIQASPRIKLSCSGTTEVSSRDNNSTCSPREAHCSATKSRSVASGVAACCE